MPLMAKFSFWLTKLAARWQKPLKKFNSATPFCKVCFQPIVPSGWHSLVGDDELICSRCYKAFTPRWISFKVLGVPALALYHYDEAVRSMLYQLKGCFDIELAGIFLNYAAPYLRTKYRGYTLICAPSAEKKDAIRGFNHVEEIFRCLHLPMVKAIVKTDDIKQADLNYRDRQKVGDYLAWRKGVKIQGEKILLVDDVHTTGATLKACVKLIQKHQPKRLKILVMSKTPELSVAR
jgi:predicted amidophosphoribosyltransferase